MSETNFRPIEESRTLAVLRLAVRTLRPTQEGCGTPGELALDADETPRLLHHPQGISADDFLYFAKDSSGPTKAAVRRVRSLVAERAVQAKRLIVQGGDTLIPRPLIEEIANLPKPPEGLGIITLEICRFVLDHTMPADTPS